MNTYFFVLGTAPELAEAELTHVLKQLAITPKTWLRNSQIIVAEFSQALDCTKLISRLGGMVKIGKILGKITSFNIESISEFMKEPTQNLTFSISSFDQLPVPLTKLHGLLKGELNQKYQSVRYMISKTALSTVAQAKQQVLEYFLIMDKDGRWIIGKTLAVQNVEEWSRRDYGRPFADPKQGMLPPKLARMMLNLVEIAPGNLPMTILDPFCGMGTILAEACMLGFNVVGSDYSETVVNKAQKNLEWLKNTFAIPTHLTQNIFVSDATHISDKLPPVSVDAIVTEPFLGSPFIKKGNRLWQKGKLVDPKVVADTIRGLEKLYLGAFKDWQQILKPGSQIVVVLPAIEFENKEYFVKKIIDNCENLGYTLTQGPYKYSRPQAVVKRNIYVFRKK